MVPPDSGRISRARPYLGLRIERPWFSLTGLSPSMAGLSMTVQVTRPFVTLSGKSGFRARAPQHRQDNARTLDILPVWAVPRSLAATGGISIAFLFLRLLRCVTSPRSLPRLMHSGAGDAYHYAPGCPIRKSPDQSLLAAPRGLSQLATSFIAILRQVILRTPLVA